MENELKFSKYRGSAVVIPAYQPSEKLIELVSKLSKSGYSVVVVDDGNDESFLKIWEQIDSCAVLLHHSHNQGKGAALKTAFRYIRDSMPDVGSIITMDADGQHLIDDMGRVAQSSYENPGTLVLGSRTFGRDVPLRSRFGNSVTRFVFFCIAKYKIQDTQTGLRAFDRSLLDYMLSVAGERYEYEMNVLLRCKGSGISVVEIPIHTVYLDKNNSSSHFDAIRDSACIYRNIFRFASERKG